MRQLYKVTLLLLTIHLQLVKVKSAKYPKEGGLDYKQPFVTFFGDENHRGAYYHHYLKKDCTNLPSQYDNWASSMNTYGRCVYVCEDKDCEGLCERVHGPGSKGLDRMASLSLNDKVSSIKYCYTFAERIPG